MNALRNKNDNNNDETTTVIAGNLVAKEKPLSESTAIVRKIL
jgi:hypothetical protein